jgi:hypothetical protein
VTRKVVVSIATGATRVIAVQVSVLPGDSIDALNLITPTAHYQDWSTITGKPTTISGYGLTDAASTGANTFGGTQTVSVDGVKALDLTGGATGTFGRFVTANRILGSTSISSFCQCAAWWLTTPTVFSSSNEMIVSEHAIRAGFQGGGGSAGTIAVGVCVTGTIQATNSVAVTNGYIFRAASNAATIKWSFYADVGSGRAYFGDGITVPDTTDATDKDTGSIVTEGGIGVEKSIVAGGSVKASSAIIGIDPGGPELLRVGGGAKVGGSLTAQRLIANDGYVGFAGDISASRGDGTGCVFFSGTGARYIYCDGNVFDFSGIPINATSYRVLNTKVVGEQASAIADVSTADATDLPSAVALANANKAKINSTLAMLRTHGLIAT